MTTPTTRTAPDLDTAQAWAASYDGPETIVAVVADASTGEKFDLTFNWETAQNYAAGRDYFVVAVADDGHMSRDDIQRLCDYERRTYLDCFGA